MARSPKQLVIAAVVIIVVMVMALYVLWFFRSMDSRHQTRAVAQECAAAFDELQKSPPGVARLDEFVHRLKAIDAGGAPAEVKQGLDDYTAAIEQVTAAFKAGNETTALDKNVEQKKEALINVMIQNEQRHWIP